MRTPQIQTTQSLLTQTAISGCGNKTQPNKACTRRDRAAPLTQTVERFVAQRSNSMNFLFITKLYDQLNKKQKRMVDSFFTAEKFPNLNNDPRLWVYVIEGGKVSRRISAPNTACTGLAETSAKLSGLAQNANQ